MAAVVIPGNDLHRLDYGERRRHARERWRAAAKAEGRASLDATIPDPLLKDPAARRTAAIAVAIVGSLTVHFGVTLLAALAREEPSHRARPYAQAVQIQMAEPPKPAAAPPPPTLAAPPPPRPAPVIQKVTKAPKVDVPPPDPVETRTPPPEPPKVQPRRVVGIDMESSTVGGGAAFAVGNTRMGQTAEVAEDPSQVEHLAPETTPPKRTYAPIPDYPSTLHGIEGSVTLQLDIDATGRVVKVTIVIPSEHEEFNRLAKDAAERSLYEPARANGVAVAASIPSTVRFQPHQ